MSPRPFVAEPWPGIHRITCDLPFPGLDHVHVYVADGPDGGLVAVDTALSWMDSYERIRAGIASIGRSVADLETIVITHAHPDHIGCAKALKAESGARLLCHPIADRMIGLMDDERRWARIGQAYAEHGWTPSPEARGGEFTLDVPTDFEHVDQGDTVRLAGGEWEVHHTPGHEWGHIALFRPDHELLLAGDTLLGKITPNIGWMVEPEDPLGQFIDSLDRLEALDPTFVLPQHGRPYEDGAQRASAIVSHHQQRLRRTIEIVMRTGPTTAITVAHELFGRDLMHFLERLALAETLAHLEYLRLRDRLTRHRDDDGLWRYAMPDVAG